MSPTSTGTVVPMPHMGVSIEEGTITVWQVAVGDAVAEGDVLCEIATDKVDMEVESPAAGVVTAIFAEAEAVVPVGEAICELDGDGAGAARMWRVRARPPARGLRAPSAEFPETPRRRPRVARATRLRESPRERPAGATRMGASILLRPPTR